MSSDRWRHVALDSGIPEHMVDSIAEWIETAMIHPALMGAFLRAVLVNDLHNAVVTADPANLAALPDWVRFLYNEAPSACYGSAEKLLAWHAKGGQRGHLRSVRAPVAGCSSDAPPAAVETPLWETTAPVSIKS